jgi:hypothetical protein
MLGHLEEALAAFDAAGAIVQDLGVPLAQASLLHVLLPQGHDPVRRPAALVPAPLRRVEPEILAEPDRRLVEITHGVHDVVDPEHAVTLSVGSVPRRATRWAGHADPAFGRGSSTGTTRSPISSTTSAD